MTTPRPFPIRFVSASTLLLTTMFLLGCQQSREEVKTMPAAAEAAAAPAEKAFLIFEGPWAVAPDPKDPGKILMIAPKTKSHKDLYASASNGATLPQGFTISRFR